MSDIDLLITRFNRFIGEMPDKRFRYQLKSIHNFLIHFQEIKNDDDRRKIISILDGYLDIICVETIDTNRECEELFYKYIEPVALIYKRDAGFKYFVSHSTIAIYIIAIDVVILLLFRNWILFTVINVLGMIAFMHFYLQSKSTRVYRVGW